MAKFWLDFPHQSPLTRYNFEIIKQHFKNIICPARAAMIELRSNSYISLISLMVFTQRSNISHLA